MDLTIETAGVRVVPHAYQGQYLWVDLDLRTGRYCPIAERDLRRFLGGSGLATYLLLRHGGPDYPPLHPQSPLVFAFSPLVGSPLTTSAKFAVASRSPLTHMINDSLVSSAFALAGKRAGVDAIVITGQCDRLQVLVVDGTACYLRPADDLKGLSCQRTESSLRSELGHSFQLAVIGPAGEKRISYATVSHDGRHAGRGGNGAVMGSKNLKAIAVRGDFDVTWADPHGLSLAAKDLARRSMGAATAKYRDLGTSANLKVLNRLHAMPTRNFQRGQCDSVSSLDPADQPQQYVHTRKSCFACTIGCEHLYVRQDAVPGDTARPVRIEYENLFALGPLCGIHELDTVLEASKMCDELGIDTISTGGTIAFAMECVERGWLPSHPWLRFGDGPALLRAIELIGKLEGIGADLARGSRAMAEQIGSEGAAIAAHVKGLEMPGYEPRAAQAMALGFAVGTRGADHNRSGAYQVDFSESVDRYNLRPEDVQHVIATENHAAIMDSMIYCKFLRGAFVDFYSEAAQHLRLVTGWNVTAEELVVTAQRIVTIKKVFNQRAGWRPELDTLPQRFLKQPQDGHPQAQMSADQLCALVAAYNLARSFGPDGFVGQDVLLDLDLNDVHADPAIRTPVVPSGQPPHESISASAPQGCSAKP